MRRAVTGIWANLYFDARARLSTAVTSGTISEADYRGRLDAIDRWLAERNIAVVADNDAITRYRPGIVLNTRTR